MPRRNIGEEMRHEWNTLVPQARALGVMVRPLTHFRGDRNVLRARLEQLRRQVAPFTPAVFDSQGELTFGVEFEFHMPQGVSATLLAQKLTEVGVFCQAENYNHSVRSFWKLVTDGSLGNYTSGRELVSPILSGQSGFEAVRKALGVLTEVGCKITKNCGMHVHVGVRQREPVFFRRLLGAYARFEKVIDGFLAKSRRGSVNQWCQPVRTLDHLRHNTNEAIQNDYRITTKYKKLNVSTFWRQGTVEFRHHQGTVEARKAEMWIRFCLRMVTAAERADAVEDMTLAGLMTYVAADETECQFFQDRKDYFDRREGRGEYAASVFAPVVAQT
jgi:hypothetical protein